MLNPNEAVLELLLQATSCMPPRAFVITHRRLLGSEEEEEGVGRDDLTVVLPPPLPPSAQDTLAALSQWLRDSGVLSARKSVLTRVRCGM